jgi:DNA-binding helix-hairpin-helix protein with protein kinase domain
MNASQILTRTGPIRLGRLLGKGAEGAVYEVAERPDIAAKIYLKDSGPERNDKLVAMQALLTPKLASLTAWPSELLHAPNGRLVGFLMPIMRGSKDIHTLYGPRSRLAEFPQADWRMLVRAAANTARAFAVLHESGCLVGDVNHGGIRVAPDATVKLIDCDSFQVRSSTKTFLCDVGVENFTPPELQGVSFRNTPRTENHDNFGLAVLIFHLLMMGRHPFAGRYRGPEDMPIPKALGQFRYA